MPLVYLLSKLRIYFKWESLGSIGFWFVVHLTSFDWRFVHIFTPEFLSVHYPVVSELFWHLIKSKWHLLIDFTQCLPLKMFSFFFFSIILGVFDMEFCIHHDNVHNSAYMRGKKTGKNTHKNFKGLKI